MHGSGASRQGQSEISCNRSKRKRSCSLSDSATAKLERHGLNLSTCNHPPKAKHHPDPFWLQRLRKALLWNLLRSMRRMESCRNDSGPVPQQIADRVQEFRRLTVAHPLLLAAKDMLVAGINEAPPGSIMMVFGPTGVGKTTLRLKVQQLLSEQSKPLMETDPSRLPFVAVEAAAPDNGTFSWRDHYRRTLVELSEPMLDCKLKPKWIHFAHDSQGQQLVRPDASAAQLRQALESAVQHRRPAAILIDEAQHLTRMASGRRLADQLEVIKSLANCTRTVHVLFGTYDLLAFRHLNGQLSRRSLDIHFRRYSAASQDDVRVFKSTVLTFQRHL